MSAIRAVVVCGVFVSQVSAGDRLTLSVECVAAIEGGPVVLEYSLVNGGPSSLDVTIKGGSCGTGYTFKGGSPTERRLFFPRPLVFTLVESGTGDGHIPIGPGHCVVARQYLHDSFEFRAGRKYDLKCSWTYSIAEPKGELRRPETAYRDLSFTVGTPDDKTWRALSDRLSASVRAQDLSVDDYEHLSLVLAGCRHEMFRPLASALMRRQPTSIARIPLPRMVPDSRPASATEALVLAVYNCSESPTEACRYIRGQFARVDPPSIAPFFEFWERQDRVKQDWLNWVGERCAGGPVGLASLPARMRIRATNRSELPPRHSDMGISRDELSVLQADAGSWTRAYFLLQYSGDYDKTQAIRVVDDFADSLKGIEQRRFDRLFAQLGNPSFREREQVKKDLVELGYRVRAQLRSALAAASDAEIRSRAEAVLADIDRQPVPPALFEIVDRAPSSKSAFAKPILTLLAESQYPDELRNYASSQLKRIDKSK